MVFADHQDIWCHGFLSKLGLPKPGKTLANNIHFDQIKMFFFKQFFTSVKVTKSELQQNFPSCNKLVPMKHYRSKLPETSNRGSS